MTRGEKYALCSLLWALFGLSRANTEKLKRRQ